MNKKLMIDAFNDAKKNNAQLIKGAYRIGNNYCSVGYLAHFSGVPDENIYEKKIIHPTGITILGRVADHYNMDLAVLSDIIAISDEDFHSWDDAIEWVKKYGEEDASNS